MVQLDLFENSNRYQNESRNFNCIYTVGVINDYETLWFVKNTHKERNKAIMEYLLMYPNTRPLQSNHKHYINHLKNK